MVWSRILLEFLKALILWSYSVSVMLECVWEIFIAELWQRWMSCSVSQYYSATWDLGFVFVRKAFIGISAISGKEYNGVKAMQSGQLSTKGPGSSVASATANKSGQVMQLRGHSLRMCGGQQYRWPGLLLIYEAWEDQCTNHISTTVHHQ